MEYEEFPFNENCDKPENYEAFIHARNMKLAPNLTQGEVSSKLRLEKKARVFYS